MVSLIPLFMLHYLPFPFRSITLRELNMTIGEVAMTKELRAF